MSKARVSSQEKLDVRLAKQQRKDFWDKFWTIVILILAAAFLFWRIVALISHHV